MSNLSILIIAILPLLIFAIVDSLATVKVAVLSAAAMALGEVLFSYFYFGEIDSFSVASIFLVLAMGGVAYLKDSRQIFYLKPAILSFAFGAFLLVTYFMGEYVLLDGITKYSSFLPEQNIENINQPMIREVLQLCSLTMGVALIVHSLVATFAALRMSRWWWFVIAGLSSYLFLVLGIIFAVILVNVNSF